MAKEKTAKKIRIGFVSATIWKNGDYHTVVLARSYKDDKGDWKDTNQLNASDLLSAAKVLERAEAWIAEQE